MILATPLLRAGFLNSRILFFKYIVKWKGLGRPNVSRDLGLVADMIFVSGCSEEPIGSTFLAGLPHQDLGTDEAHQPALRFD